MYELIATLLVILLAAHYMGVISIPQMKEGLTVKVPMDSIMGVPQSTLVVPKKVPYQYTGDVVLP